MIPVILAGGTGTRLWPASRAMLPKQFLKTLTNDGTSLFQKTILRLSDISSISSPIIVCNEEHRFIIAEQLREINVTSEAIILEPISKNTAPAIVLAALFVESYTNDTLLVLPADHLILDMKSLTFSLKAAEKLARLDANKLITFGIEPTHPEIGYGYIKKGAPIYNQLGFEIDSFVEKPKSELAKQYFTSNQYLWNSGMFAFNSKNFLAEVGIYCPDVLRQCELAFEDNKKDNDFIRIGMPAFNNCPSISIDYAVMEKTKNAVVIPLDANWSDVGSWDAVLNIGSKDNFNNSLIGDVIIQDTENSLIHSSSKLVTAIGINNHIIIETSDAILVAHKDKSQQVKDLVETLKLKNRTEIRENKRVLRPWGWYESLSIGHRFQVKQISVNSGASLSLQYHNHRAEHWIIVKGTAKVTNGEITTFFNEDQSTYIPIGNYHRLENPTDMALEIIEVQTGNYLGEDDIVRIEDNYGR